MILLPLKGVNEHYLIVRQFWCSVKFLLTFLTATSKIKVEITVVIITIAVVVRIRMERTDITLRFVFFKLIYTIIPPVHKKLIS